MSDARGTDDGAETTNEQPAADARLTPPSAADALEAALGSAAQRAGLDADASAPAAIWKAVGGVRGILESILPSLAFIIIYTIDREQLPLALGVSLGIAAIFTVLRIATKTPVAAAVGGLIAAAAAAALALLTGRGEDTFVFGLITNAVYGTGILILTLVGWSVVGIVAGYLMGEGKAWRDDPRKRRAFFWLGLAWAGLFFARLAVQLPLYFAGNVTALGTLKLVMGLPLFAPLLAVTWLVVRALYPNGPVRKP